MLIVIPTYKRTQCLKWVLQSLVQCHVSSIPERIRVLVVNNYPPAAAKTRVTVGQFADDNRFAWDVLFRQSTLRPVDNWYSAIRDEANPNEIVFLHGDDDIFHPLSLFKRYKAIRLSNADMLLSRSASRVIFGANTNHVLAPDGLSLRPEASTSIDELAMGQIDSWAPAFIGNHVYRKSTLWDRALSECFTWCDQQHWLDWNIRTLMLPYYLPFSVNLAGGKLVGLDSICVIRGGDSSELATSRFGVSGWNSGFLALCAYDVLRKGPFRERADVDTARTALRRMVLNWYATFFFDSSITSHYRSEMLTRTEFTIKARDLPFLLRGVRLLLGEWLGLRGVRLRHRFHRKSVPIAEFLESLKLDQERREVTSGFEGRPWNSDALPAFTRGLTSVATRRHWAQQVVDWLKM